MLGKKGTHTHVHVCSCVQVLEKPNKKEQEKNHRRRRHRQEQKSHRASWVSGVFIYLFVIIFFLQERIARGNFLVAINLVLAG
jgi:hypothetical protein